MCSISGILNLADRQLAIADSRSAVCSAVERMNVALRHRGPDDEGISKFEGRNSKFEVQVCLGNTRLAIIDLSVAGHQPMQDSEAGLTITYNGEIYNFRELRAEIGDSFGPWKSDTDTEVVLRAYRKWGVAAFAKLRGMFALGIWDGNQGELVLARDRFGIKPLYYYGQDLQDGQDSLEAGVDRRQISQDVRTTGNSFIFASEVRALLATGLLERKLSKAGVASYLEYGSIQAPMTIIDGVQSVLPGHYLRVRADDSGLMVSDSVFANLNSTEGFTAETQRARRLRREEETQTTGLATESDGQRQPLTRDAAVAVLKEKLTESVRLHLVSDVPLGVFLSGGMDSSALVALMSQVTKEKPKTFSVVFDDPQFSEAPHSRLVAEQFQTDHHEIHLTEDQLLDMLRDALVAMDQPTMDGVNTFVVSKAVKESGVTVALSGLGGDELFAGYGTFRRALRLKEMSGISRSLLRAAAPIGKTQLNGSVRRQKFWQLAESDHSPASVYAITRQLFAPKQIDALQTLSPQRHEGHKGDPDAKPVVHRDLAGPSDCVNTISRLEMQGYMANTLLRDTDFMSMSHSLEVRVPFVDSEVVNYVLGLPGEWKLNGRRPKPLLADVFSDLLPAKFLERSKMGFTLPFEKWMLLGMRDEISNTFQDHEKLTRSGLDYEGVARVWEGFQRSPAGVGWSRPWSLYVLAKWCQLNGVTI
jgi:asparagine synthase (glutamine-hydrolysing)